MISLLPEKDKEAAKIFEENSIMLELRWDKYTRDTHSLFAYLNDEKMPPFINEEHAKDFIYKYAINRPISQFLSFWKQLNMIHTSLTSLTHEHHNESYEVEWCEDVSQGILKFDVFIRNFNQGILYPNISLNGLRDFAHFKRIKKMSDNLDDIDKRRYILSRKDEYSAIARGISECLILAVHSALVKKAKDRIICETIRNALIDLLRDHNCTVVLLNSAWDKEHFDKIVEDVKSAIVSA